MTVPSLFQLFLYVAVLILLAKPLGTYMARVYQGERTFLDPILRPIERLVYRASGVQMDQEMGWKTYAVAMLLFSVLGVLVVYALQRLQGVVPLNPQGLGGVTPDSSWNTAVSFATNTNWQGYGGEVTMSYLTQMLALTVQNFVSRLSADTRMSPCCSRPPIPTATPWSSRCSPSARRPPKSPSSSWGPMAAGSSM
jgi:K+-transporting ATPase ATPase A chain